MAKGQLSDLARRRIDEVRRGESRSLYLGDQGFRDVPEEVFGLTALDELSLRDNSIRVIPERIRDLTNLKRIDLTANRIERAPDIPGLVLDAEAYLRLQGSLTPKNIAGLTIRRTELSESAVDAIVGLPQLRSLELEAPTGRTETLLARLDRLQTLETLRIISVNLDPFPISLRGLKNLEVLTLSRAGLREVPEWLGELTRLTDLHLARNELKTLPDSLENLQALDYLNLAFNSFPRIPRCLFGMKSLEVLDLSTQNGLITEIPADILRAPKLTKNLFVNGHPIETPPPEIISQGVEAIKNYWRQRQETDVDYLCEAKLLILGEGGAGKTSLANKIRNPAYQLREAEPSTEGIEVSPWNFPSVIHVKDQAIHRDFRVNIWDFGGQEIYHATHQFFLTRRSLYVLVADDRKEDTDFHYWLGVIETLTDGSPLLVIQNEKQDRRRDIDFGPLRSRYPNLKETYRVNLADNRGLADAVRAICQQMERLPHIGAPLPATWKRVREALERDDRSYIPQEEYFEICQREGFRRTEDKLLLSGYLHDLGIILHFQDDPILQHTIFLKPRWGAAAVYRTLDDKVLFENHGRFTRTDLARIWSDEQYAGKQHELLRLMMRFQLCYQLPDTEIYIAPQLLPATQPTYDWPSSGNLVLRYEYDFMPKGIATRLIVALHHRIKDQNLVWKSGAVFQRDSTRAEVIEEYSLRRITIRANGPDARGLVAIVDDQLERIYNSFPRLKVEKYVPCNCPECHDTPYLFSFSDLMKFAARSKPIQCRESAEMVDAAALLRDLFPGAVGEKREPRKVFVSYKQSDESIALVDRIENMLRDHGITLLRDRNEVAYRDSFREFMKRIGAGDAIVVVLSKAYLESENCMFELTEIAARGNLHKRVYPIKMPDANISRPETRLDYAIYWKNRTAALKEKMTQAEPEDLSGTHQDLQDFARFRATIDDLVKTLSDMNTLKGGNSLQPVIDQLEKLIAG